MLRFNRTQWVSATMTKNIILAFAALIAGICAANLGLIQQYVNYPSIQFLLNSYLLIPVLFLLIALVMNGNYFIAGYTDEYLPFQLSILALILTLLGLVFFTRLMILGLLLLIASAYWSKKTVQQYY